MLRRTSRFVQIAESGVVAGLSGRARGRAWDGLEQLEQRAMLYAWTAQEVYLTELVNRARSNPAAEALRLGIDLTAGLTSGELARYGPQEPLALSQYLTTAARAHSLDMANRGFFDHVNPDGLSPTDRVQAAGYGGTAGENIAAGYSSVDAAHRAWMESLGHRKNVLSLHSSFDSSFHYDEFGPGLAFNAGGTYNHYQTEDFGYPGATHVQYVLGVVFNDADSNDFYGIGEGATGIRIDVAATSAPGTVLGTYTTDAAGNFQIPMADGSFTVTFTRLSDGFRVAKSVTMSGQNSKVDAETGELLDPTPPPTDDYVNSGQWSSAGVVTINSTTGNGAKSGVFEVGGDTDLFRMTASQSGSTTITLASAGGSLSVSLLVFDASHNQIGAGSATSGGLGVTFTVTAGQDYFVLVGSINSGSVGQYAIDIVGPGPAIPPDDHADADDWANATVTTLNGSTGNGTATGTIEVGGDTDLFRFTATVSGLITLTVAGNGGAFAARFTVFNNAQSQITTATSVNAGSGAVAQFNVTAGQTYYFLASAVSGTATGAYTATITGPSTTETPDDAADAGQWSQASLLSMIPTTGSLFRVGYLESAGDTDLFRFNSSRTGRTRVVLQHPGAAYATRLHIYGADHVLIGEGSVGGSSGVGSVLDFELTAGLDYYILAEASDGTSVGLYTIEMTSLDPAPVVITSGELALWDQQFSSSLVGGRLSVGFVNWWGRPVIATQQANGTWTYVDLMQMVPSTTNTGLSGDILRWHNTRDGHDYIAMRSTLGMMLFRDDQAGSWTVRNLTDELNNAQIPSADITLFVDSAGRANIAATNIVGDVVLYCQTVKRRNDGQWRWKFRNLSNTDLEPVQTDAPFVASELVTWMTPLGTCNITFLDVDGNIMSFFKGRTDKGWALANLSQAAGTAPLVGEVSVMQMRNRTVQITGTTEEGHVWATTFREGGGWSSRDLTARFEAEVSQVRSQVSYLNKAGYGFIVTIKENGNISMFRYAAAKNRWIYQNIDLTPPDFRNMLGRLDAVVDRETGEVQIVGALDSSHLVRWTWAPGRAWAYEDISYRLAAGV